MSTANVKLEIHVDVTQAVRLLEIARLHLLWHQLGYWIRARKRTA